MWAEIVFGILGSLVLLFLLAIAYVKVTMGKCKSKRDMTGKVVIVTGSNTGIGLETVRDLVNRDAKVIIACRDVSKGEAAKRDIATTTGKGDNCHVRQLDLSDLGSVRRFAQGFMDSEDRLDVLVNNAGVMVLPAKTMTADGLDTMMATNHFGPFLLTNLLLPILKKSSPSRIVVVSSYLHTQGAIDMSDLRGERDTGSGLGVYNVTKLANVLFSLELSTRLEGTGVTCNSLHPGAVRTELGRNNTGVLKYINIASKNFFYKSPVQGAQTTIHLAVCEKVDGVSGKYFQDCKPTRPSARGRDRHMAKQLWNASAEIVGIL